MTNNAFEPAANDRTTHDTVGDAGETTGQPSAGQLSYEQAREQLVAVVTQLEAGSASLEESLALWERGEALARRCEEWLEGARARLDAARSGDREPGYRDGGQN